MIVFETIPEIKRYLSQIKIRESTVGMVPTMGCLHDGHGTLIQRSVAENDQTVVSIFLNPTQFTNSSDLSQYPKTWEADLALAEAAGASVVFAPKEREIYPDGFQTYIEVRELGKPLCGQYRSGHFIGVATVVLKLFHIIQPDRAYFGQKDYQQVCVIKQMVADLNLDTTIICCPTVREKSGLALSSRNNRLTQEERRHGAVIYATLMNASFSIQKGITNPGVLREQIGQSLVREGLKVEYVEIVDAVNLNAVERLDCTVVIAVAAYLGDIRLIDNIVIEENAMKK